MNLLKYDIHTGDPQYFGSRSARMLPSKIPSGIEKVDRIWNGGLFRGAAYLLYGAARHGRNLIALHTARTGLERGETCVYVSPRRLREIEIQAESLNFDVDAAVRARELRLVRLSSSLMTSSDVEEIEGSLGALANFVAGALPDRLIIEDFTPFVRPADTRRMNDLLAGFIERVCSRDATVLVGLGEPSNSHSRARIAMMRSLTTGAIHLNIDPQASNSSKRILTLLPLIGSPHQPETVGFDLSALAGPGGDDAPVSGRDEAQGSAEANRSSVDWNQLPQWASETSEASEHARAEPGSESTEQDVQEPHSQAAGADPKIHEMSAAGGSGPEEELFREDGPIHFFELDDPWDLPLSAEASEEDPFAQAHVGGNVLNLRHVEREAEGDASPEEWNSSAERSSDADARRPRVSTAPLSARRHGEAQRERRMEAETTGPALELSRRDFAWSFDRSRLDWTSEGQGFVALAIRLEEEHAAASDVPSLITLVRAVTSDEAVLTASEEADRIALLLPSGTAADAGALLGRLRVELARSARDAAEDILDAVATVVLPNGEPFERGASFVDYVLDVE